MRLNNDIFMKKFFTKNKKILILLFIYLVIILFWAFINEIEFVSRWYCCGVQERFFLPFPIVKSLDRHFSNIILYKNLLIDLLLPMIIIAFFIVNKKVANNK